MWQAAGGPLWLTPVTIHLLVVGWVTGMIFGVAYWMFPKFSTEQPRGANGLAVASFVLLNLGLLLRVVGEPMAVGWLLVTSARPAVARSLGVRGQYLAAREGAVGVPAVSVLVRPRPRCCISLAGFTLGALSARGQGRPDAGPGCGAGSRCTSSCSSSAGWCSS